ncbi:MAG: cytochrome c-type biogenesis protein [Burkholderiaceae bacterium]|jgi:cytochrome c-type biogenesis protein CcmH
MRTVLFLWAILLLGSAGLSEAVFADSVPPPPSESATPAATQDPAFERRIQHLETELRCLVCQNQTLADSNAGLAEDLRREVRGLALSGKSDDEIKQYLHDRYGNFVFYRPPVEPHTWLLWFGPFVLLLGTVLGLGWRIRHPRGAARKPLAEAEKRRIEELLSRP